MLQRNTGGQVIVGHYIGQDGAVWPAETVDHDEVLDRPGLLAGFEPVEPTAGQAAAQAAPASQPATPVEPTAPAADPTPAPDPAADGAQT